MVCGTDKGKARNSDLVDEVCKGVEAEYPKKLFLISLESPKDGFITERCEVPQKTWDDLDYNAVHIQERVKEGE